MINDIISYSDSGTYWIGLMNISKFLDVKETVVNRILKGRNKQEFDGKTFYDFSSFNFIAFNLQTEVALKYQQWALNLLSNGFKAKDRNRFIEDNKEVLTDFDNKIIQALNWNPKK